MKKKVIITILVIILLFLIDILTVYSLVGLTRLDSAGRLRLPERVRIMISGWEARYGQRGVGIITFSIIFLFYLILFSAIIYLIIRIRRKIKEKNKV